MRVKDWGRRGKVAASTGVVAAILAVVPALGILGGSPSQFESDDGDMVATANTSHNDWATVTSASGYLAIKDVESSNTDDSFSPGQKQDTTCPDIEGHKNPPKDDFTYIARDVEVAPGPTGHTFLYGATIRVAANGNASENIELKHAGGLLCAGSSDLLQRVAGDKMIAIDYVGGGTSAQFNVLTWVASGACFVSSHTAPCWGANPQSLAASSAEGRANQDPIAAADNSINGLALAAGQFAEFGIDLSAGANPIVPPGSCSPIAQTIWESRSSGSSFVSSTKDIVRDDVGFSNCGEIKIVKHTIPSGLNQDFGFSSNLPANALAGGTCNGVSATGAFCLNDSSGDTVDVKNLGQGTYTVSEGPNPAGFEFNNVSCDSTHATTDGTKTVSIALQPSDVITCTYVNNQLTGAIQVTKTSVKTAATPLTGAHFQVCTNAGPYTTGNPCNAVSGGGDLVTAGTAGTACVDGLAFGNGYYVSEKTPPDGYALDDTAATQIPVDNGAKCSDATFVGEAKTYTDTPLTDITVKAKSRATGGTKSSVTCKDSATPTPHDIGDSPDPDTGFADPAQVTTEGHDGLKPGTYTCTIVIDP